MTFVWQWPQILYVCLLILNLSAAAISDGKPKSQPHSLSLAMLSAIIGMVMLYFGGFFTEARP